MRNLNELLEALHNCPCGCYVGITIGELRILRENGHLVNHEDNRSPDATKWKALGEAKYWNSIHEAYVLQKEVLGLTSKYIYQGGTLTPFLLVEETKGKDVDLKDVVFKIADGGHRDDVQNGFYNNAIFSEISDEESKELSWYIENLMNKSLNQLSDEIIDEISNTIVPISFHSAEDRKTRILANEGIKMGYQQKLRFAYSHNPLWLAIYNSCNPSTGLRRSFVLNQNCIEEQEVPEALWAIGRIMGLQKNKSDIPEHLLRCYSETEQTEIDKVVEVFENFYDEIFSNATFDFLKDSKGCFKTGRVAGLFYFAQKIVDETILKKEYTKRRKGIKEEKRASYTFDAFKCEYLGKGNKKCDSQVMSNRNTYAMETIKVLKSKISFFDATNASIESNLNTMAGSQGTGKANFGVEAGDIITVIYQKYSTAK